MSADDVQTNLRLPADLKDRLVEAANENNRSLSAEASYRLEESFANKRADELVFEHVLEGKLAELDSRIAMVDIRLAMINTRLDRLKLRGRLINRDLELVKARGGHPDNDTILRAALAESDFVLEEESRIEAEMQDVLKSRERMLQEIAETKAAIANTRETLEARLREAREK